MPRSILISIKYPNTHWRESIRLVGFFSGSKFKARRIRKYTFSTPPRPRITFLRRWNPGITRSWETDAKPTICCVYRIASCLLLRIRRFNNFFVTCCMQILYGTLYVFIHPEFSLMAHEAKFVNKLLEVLYMRVIHFSFFFVLIGYLVMKARDRGWFVTVQLVKLEWVQYLYFEAITRETYRFLATSCIFYTLYICQ